MAPFAEAAAGVKEEDSGIQNGLAAKKLRSRRGQALDEAPIAEWTVKRGQLAGIFENCGEAFEPAVNPLEQKQ